MEFDDIKLGVVYSYETYGYYIFYDKIADTMKYMRITDNFKHIILETLNREMWDRKDGRGNKSFIFYRLEKDLIDINKIIKYLFEKELGVI